MKRARPPSDAVASRNGSTSDAHVLACAWLLDADTWSRDRDVAGTGWPSWSTANLRRALDGARSPDNPRQTSLLPLPDENKTST
ncbi:PIN domain-containing protein [Methylobacterium aquaticum]|uniref:PIN domain-containing protein n=1 Tax=Methylobacterium aquaticum TaxID=270351 RepID=UPI000B223059|nr:PIN domain-containing protein [Methylobacterium aquaticum]